MTTPTPLLSLRGVAVSYDRSISALHDVSLTVPQGGIVALLGANGAGKTTALTAAASLLHGVRGAVTRGEIHFDGVRVGAADAATLVRKGLIQVLEGRRCFAHLTVEENLLSGGFVRRPTRRVLSERLAQVYRWFPRLQERCHSQAGLVSGGEQQMVALGRALMTQPRLVLLDEPSMGLAPKIVAETFRILAELNREQGIGFLIAEQAVAYALRHANYAYVLETGTIAMEGKAEALAARQDLHALYLGGAAQEA